MARAVTWTIRLCTLAAVVAAPAGARGDAPMRALVLVDGDDARGWLDRIEGQVSDLPIELIAVPVSGLGASLERQLRDATAAAAREEASVVAWLDSTQTPGRVWLVHVATPDSGRLLVRRVGLAPATPRTAASGTSAALETSALVVRTALRALAAGGEIGVRRPAATSSSAPPSSRAVPATPSAPPAEAPSRKSSGAGAAVHGDLAWTASLGWRLALDGESDVGQQALRARLGVAAGAVELGLSGSLSMGADLRDQLAVLRVARHTVGAAVAWRPVRGTYELALGLWTGAALYHRSTTPRAGGVRARPPKLSVSWAFAPELALRWVPGAWGLGLTLALDVIPRPPEFAYRVGGDLTFVHDLWIAQPRCEVTVEMRL